MTLTQTSHDHTSAEAQGIPVVTPSFPDQSTCGNQHSAVGESSSSSHGVVDAHGVNAAGSFSPDQSRVETQKPDVGGSFLRDPVLALLSDSLDDIEHLRIATENRYRMLTRTEVDADGEYRGLGLTTEIPAVGRVESILNGIRTLEHQATLDLKRQLRLSPLYPWVAREKGVGEKQAARLFTAIGDPYWNDLYDRPRTVSELWAFSGYAVHDGYADRRQKGTRGNWSPIAKTRAYLVAESCMKARTGGHYRDVYLAAREQYAEATHPHDCFRCGPAGKPAPAGTPLSAGHQHARALRRTAKEILRDLWVEAKTVHELTAQPPAYI